ncbi:recombinase family protein [Ruminococcus sp. AM31-15AC]|uniref:recombinase family protein n=1 Tax=Ruminococcus sp. AM31-15AC TaxID=2293202 RepID=UPI000E4EFFC0|nr:hypothetical protein DW793_09760 [Ruminococcus sp. AM31-15AC]
MFLLYFDCFLCVKFYYTGLSVYTFRRTGSRSGTQKLEKPYYWTQRTVRGMLSNQTYCGDTVNFKNYSKSNKIRKRPDKQGEMDKYAG